MEHGHFKLSIYVRKGFMNSLKHRRKSDYYSSAVTTDQFWFQ